MVGSQGDSSALLPTKALRTEAGHGGEQKAFSPEREGSAYLTVFVSSGCCNKILQAGWLFNHSNLFLTVLEAESLRLGCTLVESCEQPS